MVGLRPPSRRPPRRGTHAIGLAASIAVYSCAVQCILRAVVGIGGSDSSVRRAPASRRATPRRPGAMADVRLGRITASGRAAPGAVEVRHDLRRARLGGLALRLSRSTSAATSPVLPHRSDPRRTSPRRWAGRGAGATCRAAPRPAAWELRPPRDHRHRVALKVGHGLTSTTSGGSATAPPRFGELERARPASSAATIGQRATGRGRRDDAMAARRCRQFDQTHIQPMAS